MSIDKNTTPSDMERVLQVHVNKAEFNAIMEHKICVVFISYDSELKKSIVLDERRTASGEKDYLFRQYDYVQLWYKDTPTTRVLRRWCGFSITSNRVFDRHNRLIGFSDRKIAIHFK